MPKNKLKQNEKLFQIGHAQNVVATLKFGSNAEALDDSYDDHIIVAQLLCVVGYNLLERFDYEHDCACH